MKVEYTPCCKDYYGPKADIDGATHARITGVGAALYVKGSEVDGLNWKQLRF